MNRQILGIQVMFGILILLSITGRFKGLRPFIFWFFMIGFIIVTYVIITRLPEKYKVASLVILSLTISMIMVTSLPHRFQQGSDEAFEAQFAQTIVDEGLWNPRLGTGMAENYYGYNPVIHMFLAFASITTGLSPYDLIRFFSFTIIRLMLVLAMLMLAKKLLPENTAYLATFIFAGTAGMMFIASTRRTIASLMLILSLYALYMSREKKLTWNILFFLLSILVVIGNHSIAFYYLVFLLGAWAFKYMPFFKGSNPVEIYHVIYYTIIFVLWNQLTGVFIYGDSQYIGLIFETMLKADLFKVSGRGPSLYHNYEMFMIYASQLVFVILGSIGFMQGFFRYIKKKSRDNFFLYFSIFCFSGYALSTFLMTTFLDVAVIIILWFFSIPLCIYAAKVLRDHVGLILTMFVCIMIFCGSLMMGIYTPRITNRLPWEDIVIYVDARAQTQELDSAGIWLEKRSPGAHVLGDVTVFEVFGGIHKLSVTINEYWLGRLYLGNTDEISYMSMVDDHVFGVYEHVKTKAAIDYYVINQLFGKYASQRFGQPFDINTQQLDYNPLINKPYSNQQIQLYENDYDGI